MASLINLTHFPVKEEMTTSDKISAELRGCLQSCRGWLPEEPAIAPKGGKGSSSGGK